VISLRARLIAGSPFHFFKMKKLSRFKDAADVKIKFDSVSERRLYLTANNKYSVMVGFESKLNNKVTCKYARYTFDCSCKHSAMRAEPAQAQNFCKHIFAAIAWLVNNEGEFK